MKFNTFLIIWHNEQPVFSIDFHPSMRIATGGADECVKIWKVEGDRIEFLSNLRRHTRAVNTVRFNPSGDMLASASDDGLIFLWKLASQNTQPALPASSSGSGLSLEDDDSSYNKETWVIVGTLIGGGKEIYALDWSSDGRLLVSGSIDTTVCVWDVANTRKIQEFREHTHYVQGCAFDPRNKFIATACLDRKLRIYRRIKSNSNKYHIAHAIKYREDDQQVIHAENDSMVVDQLENAAANTEAFKHHMFLDENTNSFFRRLSWSPDGSLLFVPAGMYLASKDSKVVNCVYIFARECLSRPIGYIPSVDKAPVIVRCNPILFKLRQTNQVAQIDIPFRIVFAVATIDSVLVYDTQQATPFVFLKDIHYASITDLAWSADGRCLGISSTDGYCSLLQFDEMELGEPLAGAELEMAMQKVYEAKKSHVDEDVNMEEVNNE